MSILFTSEVIIPTSEFDFVSGKPGEINFTRFLAEYPQFIRKILEDCEISDEIKDFEAVSEERTADGKRPDLVIRSAGSVFATVECQNSNGWLDPVHAAKGTYYAWDKGAIHHIILCENSTEEMKEYIRYLNNYLPVTSFLVEYKIREICDKLDLIFKAVVKKKGRKAKQRAVSSGTREITSNRAVKFAGQTPFPIRFASGTYQDWFISRFGPDATITYMEDDEVVVNGSEDTFEGTLVEFGKMVISAGRLEKDPNSAAPESFNANKEFCNLGGITLKDM